jgi:hypothetical protein
MIILAVMHYSCWVILGFLDFSEKRLIISIFILFETLVWFFNTNLDRKAKVNLLYIIIYYSQLGTNSKLALRTTY